MTPTLTTRQTSVLTERAHGHDNHQTADHLGLTLNQVKYALTTAAETLGVPNAGAALIGAACRAGLLDTAGTPGPTLVLSSQQRALLECLRDGLTNRQAARRMGVSENTVKSNIRLLLRSVGAANREQAVFLSFRDGLLTGPSRVQARRARFSLRVRIGSGGWLVHAWDGVSSACWLSPGCRWVGAGRARVSCGACRKRLGLDEAVTRHGDASERPAAPSRHRAEAQR